MSSAEPPKDTDSAAMPPAPSEEKLSDEDAAAIAAAMADEPAAAKSLKCADCGKLFKNADLANYHAQKSRHENFEESTEEVPPPVKQRVLT
jgi:UBX domain-containing protein 1/4